MEVFYHNAMATKWVLRIDDFPIPEAAQAADEAFIQLEKLENLLSRFIASSDIARVNALAPGERAWVQAETWDCVALAQKISAETQRAFDATAGTLVDFWKAHAGEADSACRHAGFCESMPAWREAFESFRFGTLAMHEAEREIECVAAGTRLDLGGIAKGFALDCMAKTLQEWGIARALLNAGGSTILALGAPVERAGWKIGFADATPPVLLCDEALSSSGTQFQKNHLVDPRTGLLAVNAKTVRVCAKRAGEADALSTAFFCMSAQEIEAFQKNVPAGYARYL